MTAFLWTMALFGALEVLGVLWLLAQGAIPPRTPRSMAVNATIMSGLGVWALVLLLRCA